MIAVFVRDEHGMNVFGLQAGFTQARLKLPDSQPAIDQQPQWAQAYSFDDGGVAGTATAQAFKSEHLFSDPLERALA